MSFLEKAKPFNRTSLFLFFLLSACASQQSKVNQVSALFRAGNLTATQVTLVDAIPNKSNLYYLESGIVSGLMGLPRIPNSTQSFLAADQLLQQNELKRSYLKNSLSALGGYFLSEGIGKEYELKPYEGSQLAYRLALNHVLAGSWENGRVEVTKMVAREKSLAEFNALKYQAIEEKRAQGISGMSGTINTRVEASNPIIGGYPVNTFSSPEVLHLKNSYQSAAAHYLAAFIFEKLGEPSLAAPGYRQAIELRPDLSFLREGLQNLDQNTSPKNLSNSIGTSDTLFVIETGYLPQIDNFKINLPIPFGNVMKFATISYPVIQPNTEQFNPEQLGVDGNPIVTSMVTSLDAMVRRDLRDEMPGYILRGTSRAITQVLTQIAVEKGIQGNNRNNSNQAALGAFASLLTGVAMSEVSSADIRHWTLLPAQIYMARQSIPNGVHQIAFRLPTGYFAGRSVNFQGGKTLVYIRIFRDKATIISSSDKFTNWESITQPVMGVLSSSKDMNAGQPMSELKR